MNTKNANIINRFVYLNKLEYLKLNKFLCLLVLQLIIFAVMISMILLGYNNNYNDIDVQLIPENIAVYRSISIFFMAWYIVIYIFIVNIKFTNQIPNIIKYLTIIPIFNLIAIGYIIFKNNWQQFPSWFLNLFYSDLESRRLNLRHSWKYKMMIGLLILMTPILVIAFYQKSDYLEIYPINGIGEPIVYKNLWFCSLQYFTIQTNLFCYSFVLLFVIKPDLKIFKYNSFLISCIVYIFIVGVTYDFALFPVKVVNGELAKWNWYKYFCNIYEHLINPVAFVTCGIIYICKDNVQLKKQKYSKFIFYSLIIPLIYLIYATVLPFISNVSVYGFVTNCNPNVYNEILVDKSSYLSNGNPINILFIIGYAFLFFGLLTGVYYLNLYKAHLWKVWKHEKRYCKRCCY